MLDENFYVNPMVVLLSSSKGQLRLHVNYADKRLCLSVMHDDGYTTFYSADQFGDALDEYEGLSS